jgi:RNA polymerase sigma factor (sigma-70 family)
MFMPEYNIMASPLTNVIQRLRRVVLRECDDVSDGKLLDRFVATGADDAFATLLHRHAAMVLGVCRRILGNAHDAEDAFQATFLVLIRKAAGLRGRRTVGDWLYGVAYHTALKARAASGKRRVMEQRYQRTRGHLNEAAWRELEEVLDRELSSLPEKYRAPLVLCDLEGKSRKDAARQLGCPEGTVSGRLARARVLLSKRLSRRGVVISGGLLATALTANASAAAVPAPLLLSTSKAVSFGAASQAAAAGVISAKAAALTQGVLKAMFLTKLKIATGFLLAVGLAFGALVYGTAEAQTGGGAAKKPQVQEIDLSKLPPELVKQIQESLKKADQAKTATKTKKDGKDKDSKDEGQNDDGQKGQNDDGQKGQNDDGQKGQNDDGEKGKDKKAASLGAARNVFVALTVGSYLVAQEQNGNKDDGQQNQKDDGQQNQKDDGQKVVSV